MRDLLVLFPHGLGYRQLWAVAGLSLKQVQNGEVRRLLPSTSLGVRLRQALAHSQPPQPGIRPRRISYVNTATPPAIGRPACQLGSCSGECNDCFHRPCQPCCPVILMDVLAKGHYPVPLSVHFRRHSPTTIYDMMLSRASRDNATASELTDAP